MINKKHHTGFSLIELAVVLMILGVLTSMGILAGMGAVESARRVATNSKLDEIEKALFKYREVYNRLPCPADATLATTNTNYGVEAANPGSCTGGTPAATYTTAGSPSGVPSGAVPTRTLGLPLDYMYDGWGRKFQYEVVADMTYAGSFSLSHPSSICIDNGITIRNEADSANIVAGVVYAINSYGNNGIGAYLRDGTRFTIGTAGTDEADANRSSNTNPSYVYKYSVRGEEGTSGYYDDILRFKTRMQLMNDDDRNKVWFDGPDLILARDGAGTPDWAAPKFICGRLSTTDSADYSDQTDDYEYAAFTPDNSALLIYTGSDCELRSITNFTSDSGAPSCAANATAYAMAGNTGTFAINQAGDPYITVWRYLSDGSYAEIMGALSPALASKPTHLSFSDDGVYLAVTLSTATTLYKYNGTHYQEIQEGTSIVDDAHEVNAISPDGRFYVEAAESGSDLVLYAWRNRGGTFVEFDSTINLDNVGTATHIVFSPDSQLVAIAGDDSNIVAMVWINDLDNTMSAMTISSAPSGVQMMSFSPDNRFFVIANGSTGYNLYRQTAPNTYTAQTVPAGISGGAGDANVAVFRR